MTSRRVQTVLSTGHHPPVVTEEKIEVPGEIYAWKADPAHAVESRPDAVDEIGSYFSPHFRVDCRVWGMSAMRLEMVAFKSGVGTKAGHTLQILSPRQDT